MKKSGKTVSFSADILRFKSKGEKTGWTYIEIPSKIANSLSPGNKKSFRVKGKLDDHPITGVSLLPMGGGNFILPVNAAIRKGTGKVAGGKLIVSIEIDKKEPVLNKEMLECIKDEPVAEEFFSTLTKSHQFYFSKWVDSAKSAATKTRRIVRIVNALVRKMNYAEMLRAGDDNI